MRLARAAGMPTSPRPARRVALVLSCATLGALAPALACAPRQVNVSSGPEPAATTLAFTNRLRTAVNVYVRDAGGNETFIRQVPAGANEALVVRNVARGAVVSLRAAPINGGPAFNRDNVTLGTGAAWTIP